MPNTKLLFGSMIVVILLGLYCYSLIEAIDLALTEAKKGEKLVELNAGITRTLATVGALVSALVVAELAITEPGEKPQGNFLAPGNVEDQGKLKANITTFYIVIWILFGLAAYVVGEMQYPGKVPALTDFAQAWLGLAIAAGYAYFGIKKR